MKSRNGRIKDLTELFEKSEGPLKKDDICQCLDISQVSLGRYVKILKEKGYEITLSCGSYTMVKSKDFDHGITFSKKHYTSIKILMYIANHSCCLRKSIIKDFGSNYEGSKMGLRNLDRHLKELELGGYITKSKFEGEICYRANEGLLLTEGIKPRDAANLICQLQMLKHNVPFEDGMNRVISKLIASISSYIKSSNARDMEFLEDFFEVSQTRFDYDLFQEKVIEMWEHIVKNNIVRINTVNQKPKNIVPVNLIYNWNNCEWYLAYSSIGTRSCEYSLLKLTKIIDISYVSTLDICQKIRVEKIREIVNLKVDYSFGLGFDKGVEVDVIFLNHFNVVDKAKRKLMGRKGEIKILEGGELRFVGIMEGIKDFLSWLRQFGSSVVIMAPKWLQNRHIETAKKVLEGYGVEYE